MIINQSNIGRALEFVVVERLNFRITLLDLQNVVIDFMLEGLELHIWSIICQTLSLERQVRRSLQTTLTCHSNGRVGQLQGLSDHRIGTVQEILISKA